MARARRFPFTDGQVEALPVPRGRVEYADTVCRGLRLRVGKSGVRTFLLYGRDAQGTRTVEMLGRWSASGVGGTLTVEMARARYLDRRGAEVGHGGETSTVGELLDLFEKRGRVSAYTLALLRKHLAPVHDVVAAQLGPAALADLVARVQRGYADEKGRAVGGPAVADKVRGGLRSLFAWAQRQGRFPADRALPTLGLVRDDFAGIGWKPRERVPSEAEVKRLLAALGVGTGERITVDLKVSPRVSLAARLAVLLLLHVPVRSGAGVLSQPASAADLDAGVLRWRTRKGRRDEALEAPLSSVAVAIVKELRALDGGGRWLVPSPEDPEGHIDTKVLARLFTRLQASGREGQTARVQTDDGAGPFTPHSLRGLWTTLAGDLGVDDGVAVRVIGHQPEGASAAHRFYDRSQRMDFQRAAAERVSAELERIRRGEPRPAASVGRLDARRA